MLVVKAPNSYVDAPRPWIFLTGSIEMGKAVNWQQEVEKGLAAEPGTILNPRRDNWDSSWVQSIGNARFREQVEWELRAQERADCILLYFAPGTQSPITLLELGLFHHRTALVVCCPKGFWRKGNVDIVCERYGVKQVATLNDLIREGRRLCVSV